MKNATVKIKQHKGKFLQVLGKIKDTRMAYGRKEFLITKGKIDDCWITEGNIIMRDE